MFHISLTIIVIISAWIFGDWRNWEKYYPTTLFLITCNFLYTIKSTTAPFWLYQKGIFPNNTSVDLIVTLIQYPCFMLIYLYRFPKDNFTKKVFFIIIWAGSFSLIEILSLLTGNIKYFNGWTLTLSILFNLFMFPLLYLHYRKPLYAWAITFVVIIFVCIKYSRVLF